MLAVNSSGCGQAGLDDMPNWLSAQASQAPASQALTAIFAVQEILTWSHLGRQLTASTLPQARNLTAKQDQGHPSLQMEALSLELAEVESCCRRCHICAPGAAVMVSRFDVLASSRIRSLLSSDKAKHMSALWLPFSNLCAR